MGLWFPPPSKMTTSIGPRAQQEAKCCFISPIFDPGTYNVTVFMGRTNDNDGQFGKAGWMISPARKSRRPKTPVILAGKTWPTEKTLPLGQPRTGDRDDQGR